MNVITSVGLWSPSFSVGAAQTSPQSTDLSAAPSGASSGPSPATSLTVSSGPTVGLVTYTMRQVGDGQVIVELPFDDTVPSQSAAGRSLDVQA